MLSTACRSTGFANRQPQRGGQPRNVFPGRSAPCFHSYSAVRRRFLSPLLLLLLLLAGGLFCWAVDPVAWRFTPQCPIRQLTGWSCPACGLQRAAHALLHGRFLEALHYNFFFLFSVPFAAGACFSAWWPVARWRERAARIFFSPQMLWTYIGLFFTWAIVRNVLDI